MYLELYSSRLRALLCSKGVYVFILEVKRKTHKEVSDFMRVTGLIRDSWQDLKQVL